MHIGRKWLIAFEVVNKSSPRWACDSCLRKIRYNKLPFLHSYIQLHRIDWNLQENVQFEYLWHLYWSASSMAKGFIEFPSRVAFCVTGKLRCTLIHLNVYASESDCIQRKKWIHRIEIWWEIHWTENDLCASFTLEFIHDSPFKKRNVHEYMQGLIMNCVFICSLLHGLCLHQLYFNRIGFTAGKEAFSIRKILVVPI